MWGFNIRKWLEKGMKWLDANWFKIKLFAFLFIVGSGCFLALKVVEVISGIESSTGRIIAGIFVGISALAVTYFVSYLHGFRNATLKKDEEIKRYKRAVSDQENSVSQVVKLQGEVEGFKREIERKKEAYGHLKSEIRKIKSQEDREALERKWDEIRDQYEMTLAPLAEAAAQPIKVIAGGTQDLLEKGWEGMKKIPSMFKGKKKDKGGLGT